MMNAILRAWGGGMRLARNWAPLASAIYFELASSPLVWAAKKKKDEVAAPTKSYVLPYMIVIAVMALGLMTALRPGKRADSPEDKRTDKEE